MIQSISLFPDAYTTTPSDNISVNNFLLDVKNGKWLNHIIPLRAAIQSGKPKGTIDSLKKKLPLVTGSGTFTTRSIAGLDKHSGFLVADLDFDTLKGDHINIKQALSQDPLFYALFYSCSGKGICGLIRINPKAHLESFNFVSEHLYTKYGLNIDEKCKDVSRARFVTYDDKLYLNENSQLCPFNPLLKKDKQAPPKYHFNDEDFKRIIEDINRQAIDLTADYNDWIKCGFALVDKFGEEGRDFFHEISKHNGDYDYDKTDAKYNHLLHSKDGDITIDWFYHIIEKNGLQAYGKGTQDFLQQTLAEQRAYEAGLIDTRPLGVNLVGLKVRSQDVGMQIRNFLHKGYRIVKNEMTQAIEINEEVLDDELLNTVYLLCRSVIDKIGSREIVYQVMDSRFTPRMHPVKDFLERYFMFPPEKPYGHIDKLIATIDTDTPHAHLFIKKWLVSIIGAAHGKHSALMLILQGVQNNGKTSWLRHFLPKELASKYYAESKMDEGKDDAILMSKKMVIMDDEMSGKSKQENNKMKSRLSAQNMDLRVPYGRTASSLRRIATLAGTINDEEVPVLSDPTGNRRFIVVGVNKIDYDAYNSINKGLLFYELYLEYIAGFSYEMTTEEIKLLNESTQRFTPAVAEEELIGQFFALPDAIPGLPVEEMTGSMVYDYLKTRTRLPINSVLIGRYLKKLGFVQRHRATPSGGTSRMYSVCKITDFNPTEEIL